MQPVVSTQQGDVRGIAVDGVSAFKGIPYAAPPVGPLRFAAPAEPQPWHGERDASEYGPTPPKPPYPKPIAALLPEPSIPGDDILNLNVWTPDTSRSLPVLVWIHGGAFVNGSGAVPVYDGTNFARDGVVCVTINYRLGAQGFALIDGAPGNRGLLDQIAALRWVQANIAAFGGDPRQVTIAGESAGAMSVTTLLSLAPRLGPSGEELFHRAIAESGAGHHVLTAETAGKVSSALADDLGVPASADGFGSVPVDALIAAQEKLAAQILTEPNPVKWGEVAADMMPFEPYLDGELLTVKPIEPITEGAAAGVDILIGTNADEYTLFLVPRGVHRAVNEDLLRGFLAAFGVDVEPALAAYRDARPDGTPGELFMDALRDEFFRVPAVRVAESQPERTHVYEFTWRSPQLDGQLGATHALEIAFVFDNLGVPGNEPLGGTTAPQELADEMHRAWVGFVASGDPGWPAYGQERRVMRFGGESVLVSDPAAELRKVWEGKR